jgi:penicillin-binding protein 1A
MGRLGGGSTITQQLIKNMVLSNDRTVTRKLAEILLSLRLEKRLSKEQVSSFQFTYGQFD